MDSCFPDNIWFPCSWLDVLLSSVCPRTPTQALSVTSHCSCGSRPPPLTRLPCTDPWQLHQRGLAAGPGEVFEGVVLLPQCHQHCHRKMSVVPRGSPPDTKQQECREVEAIVMPIVGTDVPGRHGECVRKPQECQGRERHRVASFQGLVCHICGTQNPCFG